MATQIQFRRGTASQHNAFTGATAEITVNTTNKSAHVHDGTTQGGFELARADLSNTSGVTNQSFSGVTTVTTLNVSQNVTVSGITTLGISSISQLWVAGVSTFVGSVTFQGGTINLGDAATDNVVFNADVNSNLIPNTDGAFDLGSNSQQWKDLYVTGTADVDALTISGVSTFSGGIVASSTIQVDGYATFNDHVDIDKSLDINSNFSVTGISTLTGPTLASNINATGVVTATTFIGNLTGNASTASGLQTSRSISLTGDVVGSVYFDGYSNVSIAATIQPDSVALGTDTTGDYVQSVSGTTNQITVTGGTGESSTPTLSIPNQFTAPQDVTVTRDLQVDRNLNVNGNITIGGTSATLFTSELKIYDPDIVLGFRTDAFDNDISTDNTANHGGIAIASTEGSPLVDLFIAGIETTPTTYKKIMWFKEGTFSGLGTDAWLFNYGVGIGSTQVPNGVRLAAGNVQITKDDLTVVRNINASGIVTATNINVSGVNASGVVTATDFNSTSDIHLKEKVEPIQNASELVGKLEGVHFNWKENGKKSIGVIAQQIEEHLPELIQNNQQYKTVNYNGLIGVLIEAVKDQQKQIYDLKNEIEELKKK